MGAIGVLKKLMMACGGFTILLGLVILLLPVSPEKRQFVESMVGVMLLSSAAIYLLLSWLFRKIDSLYLVVGLAAVTLASGLLILLHPLDTFLTFYTLMAVMFLLEGALLIGLSLNRRSHGGKLWHFVMSLGIISLVCAVLLWFVMAGSQLSTVRILIGLTFIARGGVYGLIGSLAEKPADAPNSASPGETPVSAS